MLHRHCGRVRRGSPLLEARTAASTFNHKLDAIEVEYAQASHRPAQNVISLLHGILPLSTSFFFYYFKPTFIFCEMGCFKEWHFTMLLKKHRSLSDHSTGERCIASMWTVLQYERHRRCSGAQSKRSVFTSVPKVLMIVLISSQPCSGTTC